MSKGEPMKRRSFLKKAAAGLAAGTVAAPAITVIAGGQPVSMEEPEPGRFVCDLPPRSGPVLSGAQITPFYCAQPSPVASSGGFTTPLDRPTSATSPLRRTVGKTSKPAAGGAPSLAM